MSALALTTGNRCTPPRRIDEAKFDDALNVLPPARWVRRPGSESFQMIEHLTVGITAIYARVGDVYWTFNGPAGLKHDDVLDHIRANGGLS